MNRLAEMTWRDAESALARAQVAILPTGSIEQHGPHMALETDIAVGEALAERLAEDLGELAVLCPRIDYGLSEHHMRFPGTITLRPETFSALVLDVVASLAQWGVRRVLVVNGHGGNIDALRLISRTARRDLGCLVASLMWAQVGADEISKRTSSESYGHACEVETSVAMVLAPEVVHAERIEAPSGRRSVDPLIDPPRPKVDQTVLMHEWTDDGALGDPRLHDIEDGKAIVEVVSRRALEFARRFARQPLPDPAGGAT
ncbi:MAG: creatininase family protein [Acidimicrobiia bacterium]